MGSLREVRRPLLVACALLAACALIAACSSAPAGEPQREPSAPSAPASPAPGEPAPLPVDPAPAPAPAPTAAACPKSPCAARPVIFIHGQGGSSDDGQAILSALTAPGERFDSASWVGTGDHAWAPRSIPRREWLFAFDYYLRGGKDGRGTFTAGPGRIGSDGAHVCTAPAGKSQLVPDHPEYDAGITHEFSADLAAMIDSVLLATGAPKVDIVAHSMGGLVTRAYLTFQGGRAEVDRVLFLASPHLGVPFAALGSYFIGEPWMRAHELTELDRGSFFAKAKFSQCGAGVGFAPWPNQLLAAEGSLGAPALPLFSCMGGSRDILVDAASAAHPHCRDFVEVPGADHAGLLSAPETLARARGFLGGLYAPE